MDSSGPDGGKSGEADTKDEENDGSVEVVWSTCELDDGVSGTGANVTFAVGGELCLDDAAEVADD